MLEHKRWRYFNRTDIVITHPYSVHFDVFTLHRNEAIQELGSWRYPIYFDYLPAFRLAIALRFPFWFDNATLDPCQQSRCNENSTCQPIFNHRRSHYCTCNKGHCENECSLYESRCGIYCSANALCRPDYDHSQLNKTKIIFICLPGFFGRRCFLEYDECTSNPCWNNGTCFLIHSRSGEVSFICSCSQRFHGKRCENESASYQKVYAGVPSTLRYLHSDANAPYISLLKTYDNEEQVKYFIMYVMLRSVIDIDSVPQQCLHVSLHLSKNVNRSAFTIAQYHHFCQNDTGLLCFYDGIYLCLCETENE
ncbi:unnamed protein product [Rotaria socialis]